MDMKCSVHLRPAPERQAYIDVKTNVMLAYFRVDEADRERFLTHPKTREVLKVLRSVNMTVEDIAAYLGGDFAAEFAR